jgi:hypothetical protein
MYRALAPGAAEVFMSIEEKLRHLGRKEGRKVGREEGREEGLLAGQRLALCRLIERRFGSIPDAVLARIEAADTASLSMWFDRAVTARVQDEVFAEPKDRRSSRRRP